MTPKQNNDNIPKMPIDENPSGNIENDKHSSHSEHHHSHHGKHSSHSEHHHSHHGKHSSHSEHHHSHHGEHSSHSEHHHSHHHSAEEQISEADINYIGVENYRNVNKKSKQGKIYYKRKNHNKKMKVSRKVAKVLIIIFIIIAILFTTVLGFFLVGKNQMLKSSDKMLTLPKLDNITEGLDGKSLIYKGETYILNEKVTNILCMGIDKNSIKKSETFGANGQADANFLMAVDTSTGKVTVISINRDTVVDSELYSESGAYIGKKKEQICLVYANGDGKEKSCNNMTNAVSNLLYGIPINTYYALDIEGVGVLNDAVGGVTVTPKEDFNFFGNVFTKGVTVKLDTAEKAVAYIRHREFDVLNSNAPRMSRQIDYLKGFSNAAIERTKADITFPIDLYNISKDYNHNNINLAKLTFLTSVIMGNKNVDIDFKSYGGKVSELDGSAALYPDETELFQLVLDTYFTKQ